jgi:NADPH:quinone reductase-like Zn-dependent oxidoreductase
MREKIKTEAIILIKNGDASQAFERKATTINVPKSGEVLIESEAFGLNYADVMARRGLYREAPPLPAVIGYEVVGRIIALGEGVNPNLLEKRVIAFCRFGGYAKHVVSAAHGVAVIQETPAEEAMALCTQAVTAYYMSEYLSPIHKGDRVLIHAAAGGVGTILIQLAKQKGAEVFAKIGDEKKEKLVKSLGADHIINYTTSDYAQQIQILLKGNKLDSSFNPVAGSTFKKDMKLLGAGGKIVLFGGSELASGKWGFLSQLNFVRKMGFFLPIALMMQSKNILGVNMLKIADNKPEILENCLQNVILIYENGKLIPQVGGKYHVNEIVAAHTALESGKTTGKLSVFWEN